MITIEEQMIYKLARNQEQYNNTALQGFKRVPIEEKPEERVYIPNLTVLSDKSRGLQRIVSDEEAVPRRDPLRA